jgi:transcriptional regulator NrdR family protein
MDNCPKCGKATFVHDTRLRRAGSVYRRRRCTSCDHRFATIELPAEQVRQMERHEKLLENMRRLMTLLDIEKEGSVGEEMPAAVNILVPPDTISRR